MSCARGKASRVALGSVQWPFIKYDNQILNPSLVDVSAETLTGSFEPREEDVIPGEKIFRFALTVQPSPKMLTQLWPLMRLTNGGSGNVWTPDATFPTAGFNFDVDYGTDMFRYAGTCIDKVVFEGQTGNTPFTMKLVLIAQTEADLGSWSASAIPAGSPMAFRQATFNNLSAARNYYRWAMSFDYHVVDEFYNSQTATDLCPQAWDVNVAAAAPYNSTNIDMYTSERDGTHASGSATITGTNVSTVFSFGKLIGLPKPPDILQSLVNIKLPLSYRVRKTGSTALVTITHDDDPA